MNLKNILRAYGKPLSILVFSIVIAIPLSNLHAQYGTPEEQACTAAGGTYYLNVDCNSGGVPPGFMSSCWICEPAAYTPPDTAWCTSQGGMPVWNVIDAQMAGGYWDCILPTCTNGSAGPYPSCPLAQPTCADLGYSAGVYPDCYNTTTYSYSQAAYAVYSYSQAAYAVYSYSQGYYYTQGSYAPGAPVPSMSASPSTIAPGGTSSLLYSCTNTSSNQQNILPTVGTLGPTSGSVTVSPSSSQTYTLTCYGSTVTSTQAAVNVAAPICSGPSVTITASPNRVKTGQTSTLTVSASGITSSCTVTGPGVNTTISPSSCNASGTITTPAITKQSVYKVSCDSGAATAQIIINLIPSVVEF